jgi:TonB family protein
MKKALFLCLMTALECYLFPQFQMHIADIKGNKQYLNKTVYISGKVVEVNKVSTAECKYMIRDEQGDKILVKSAYGCPALYKAYNVRGMAITDKVSFIVYFKEEERMLITGPTEISEIIDIVDDEEEEDEVIDVVDDDLEVFDAEEDEDLVIIMVEEDDEYQEEQEEEEMVFIIVEDMPKFHGGHQNDFRKWVQGNLQYPDSAVAKGISGKVYVQFVVNSRGQVVNATIMRGVDPYLDNEALRVINSSPPWEPGKQRGKPVSVMFTFPVVFILE